MSAGQPRRAGPSPRGLVWLVGAAVPILGLLALRTWPTLDVRWQNHPAHFWLVLGAAALALGLGYTVSVAARGRHDARLFFLSLAFMASAGFLALHALATPGVLLGPNPGFELATPAGLLVGSACVALSARELSPAVARWILHRGAWLRGALLGLLVVWGGLSLGRVPPLVEPLAEEQLDGWQAVLAAIGVLLYGAAATGYLSLYRRRGARFVFAVTLAFVLLAEAMVVIAFAQNWLVSWWQWHVMMLGAFALIAFAARQEWHEERFSPLYLEQTLAGVKEASVLFADLEHYTSYSENESAAGVAAMLNAYFGRLVPLMQDMGGDVHQIIGDALMVIFNKDGDQADHALLAARAGLALQGESAAVAAEHPGWPRFRVGVNSGEVLAGVVGGPRGHRKHDFVGDTVNLAARLEGLARVGEVVIGAGTYERLPAGSVAEPLPPQRVKGKAAPVTPYVLRSVPGGPTVS